MLSLMLMTIEIPLRRNGAWWLRDEDDDEDDNEDDGNKADDA